MYRDAELGRKNFALKWMPAPHFAEEEMKISFRISAEEMRQMEGVGAKVGRSKLGQYAKKAPTGDAKEKLGKGKEGAKNKALAAREKAAAAKAATSALKEKARAHATCRCL